MSKVADYMTELVTPFLEQEGFELIETEFVKEGKSWFLRFYVDKEEGIDLDDCAFISEHISELIDAQPTDPIPQAYFLEVSSPGAERPIKAEEDWKKAIGKYIHLSFYKAVNGAKFIEGTLSELTEDSVVLTVRVKTVTKTIQITRSDIAKARLAIQF